MRGARRFDQKLLETPQNWASSTLLTLTNAVDLMDDLCAPSVNPELATNPPIQMLVVDDDLVSRRAIVGALQVAFENRKVRRMAPRQWHVRPKRNLI